ncbi:hypothetical protein GRJ2_000604200 [Grus japonensis]|uniref:Uncharacterized protein n=1 Tax=Grus japonensis TaxID=30415 RepID=A0ABC9W9E7_GRUJA
MESPYWSRVLEGTVTLWRTAHAGTALLAGPVAYEEEPMLEQFVPEAPMLEQFLKNCSLWKVLVLEMFVKDCLLWEGPHAGAGEECEEEGAAETKRDELTRTPFPCTAWERGVRRVRIEV